MGKMDKCTCKWIEMDRVCALFGLASGGPQRMLSTMRKRRIGLLSPLDVVIDEVPF